MDHPDQSPTRLKVRADFLRAAKGRKAHAALFSLQMIGREAGTSDAARVGFTVTKKVGNAVERNRIKRRLREAVRITPDLGARPAHDYVVVARRAVLDASFRSLVGGLKSGFGKLHDSSPRKPRPSPGAAMSLPSQRCDHDGR